jgi:hypothetical protein
MNMPGFTADVALFQQKRCISLSYTASGLSYSASASDAVVEPAILCVRWFCCDEQIGCGWNCDLCVLDPIILGPRQAR